jgi:hypothetical protein
MAKTLQFRRGTTSELAAITPAAGEILIDTTLNTIKIGNDTVEGGKIINGLSGSSYIYVTGNGTDTANGEELAAAYALAKTMTPYGSSLQDPDNRVKVIIAPGKYYVGGGTAFPNNRWDIDAHCVDIVSLTGNRDVWIIGDINIAGVDLGSVIVSGLDVSNYIIFVGNNLEFLTMENCKASSLAHCDVDGMPISLSGTFIDCEAVSEGFATVSGSDASGTFINCKADTGFGFYDCNASGVFTNCTISYSGFAYSYSNTGYGIASGTFTNCAATYEGFGGGDGGQASGVFTNCVGSNGSFAGYQTGPNTFSGTITGTLNYCRLTYGEFAPTSDNGKLHYCIDGNGKEVTSGGGLGGTSYVFVAGDQSSAVANGQQLLNAYALAKTITPYGQLLSYNNRVRVVVAPGNYDIQSNFTIDTDYVDVVSLTGNRDVILSTSNSSTFNVTASVYINGLDLLTNNMSFTIADNLYNSVFENCSGGSYSFGGDNSTVDGRFINCEAQYNSFGGNNSNVNGTFINCKSADYSFGGNNSVIQGRFNNCQAFGNYNFGGDYSNSYSQSQFINCEAFSNSFGGTGSQVSGIYTDCTAQLYCFGGPSDLLGSYYTTVDGTFTNCKATSDAFGANDSEVYGVFTNCQSDGIFSFGGDDSEVSGTFTNCSVTNGNSFGGNNSIIESATFIDCKSGINSFGGSDSNISYSTFTNCISTSSNCFGSLGTDMVYNSFTNCISGQSSFGSTGSEITNSTFTNCVAESYSFGFEDATIDSSSTFTNCIAGNYSFGGGGVNPGNAGGTYFNCVAGTNSFGGGEYGIASGTFNNCVAKTGSFGQVGDLTGKAYYCTTTGTFPIVSSGGKTFYCVDSSGPNNQ